MKITVSTFTVHKKFPLQISRGTTSETTNIWLKIAADGIEGWGEASPFSVVKHQRITTEQLVREITSYQFTLTLLGMNSTKSRTVLV